MAQAAQWLGENHAVVVAVELVLLVVVSWRIARTAIEMTREMWTRDTLR